MNNMEVKPATSKEYEIAITKFYNRLINSYTSKYRLPKDRARDFRQIFEDFLKYTTNKNDLTLHEMIKDFYFVHKIKEVKSLSIDLKNRLNEITHNDFETTDREVKTYFESLIRIIYITTSVQPPNTVLDLLGIGNESALDSLNDNQRKAVLDQNRIVFVNAGPGTGKTHLLVNKIYSHIQNSQSLEHIVALSYTNSSASELQTRLSEKIFYSKFKDYKLLSGTIHSFAFNVLKSYSLNETKTQFNYIILDDEGLEFFSEELTSILEGNIELSTIKNILEHNFTQNYPADVVKKIKDIKNKYNLISFKDILMIFHDKLLNCSVFSDWIRSKITFMLIDEAQDLTQLEYKILNLLLKKTNTKLFLVGDPRQNIFGFNGGSFSNLSDFLDLNKSSHAIHVLDISYRCPGKVLDKLNNFEFLDCENYPIKSDKDGIIDTYDYVSKNEEAIQLVKIIKEISDNNNTALLSPSLSYFSHIADELNKQQIPFITMGGRTFLLKYIRFIIHFLSVINDNDNVISFRYLHKFFRLNTDQIGDSSDFILFLNKLRSRYEFSKISISDIKNILDNKSPSKAITDIYSVFSELINFVTDNDDTEIKDNISKFTSISGQSATIDEFLSYFTLNKEVFKSFFVKDLNIESLIQNTNDFVTLSTIHSSKGLEWKNVIVPGLSDGIFPNPYFCEVKDNPKKTQENYNDDFKKLYVSMSRTKSKLILSYPKSYENKYGKVFHVNKSRFLLKIGL